MFGHLFSPDRYERDPLRPSLLEDVPTEQEARFIRAGRLCVIAVPLAGAAIGALIALAFR